MKRLARGQLRENNWGRVKWEGNTGDLVPKKGKEGRQRKTQRGQHDSQEKKERTLQASSL